MSKFNMSSLRKMSSQMACRLALNLVRILPPLGPPVPTNDLKSADADLQNDEARSEVNSPVRTKAEFWPQRRIL